jgi:hypothetical protein
MNSNSGNGNGDGHTKIFDLQKAEDPLLAKIVPQARRQCCEDTRLTEGARMLYCWLTDCSLWFGVYIRKGVIKFADTDLAKKFSVSRKTIQNWKHALETTGRIWLTERWNKNSFPTTVYNITAIVGQAELPLSQDSADGSLTDHETFAASNRHPGRFLKRGSKGKFACRLHGEVGCELCRQRTPSPPETARPPQEAKTPQAVVNEGPAGKNLPATSATNCQPPAQPIALGQRNQLPAPTAIDCRGGAQPIAVADGNPLPLSSVTSYAGGAQPVAGNGRAGDVSLESPETTFERSTLNARNGGAGARKLNGEDLFLADVRAMMEAWKPGSGKTELSGSGAWWRLSYRQSPDLMQRILAEVRCLVKEGRIKINPGSAAVDLFNRWGGVKAQRQQKAAATTAACT